MTCAICRYYNECYFRNTMEACTHDPPDEWNLLSDVFPKRK